MDQKKNPREVYERYLRYYQTLSELGKDFSDWLSVNRKPQLEFGSYVIWKEDDMHCMFSRRSGMLQCYYMGYGWDQQQLHIDRFEDLDNVFAFIEKAKGMEIIHSGEMAEHMESFDYLHNSSK